LLDVGPCSKGNLSHHYTIIRKIKEE